jgi:hypothetical protein
LPGLPAAVAVPPSVLAAGLFARGVAGTTYAADPVPGPAPPEPPRTTPAAGGCASSPPAGGACCTSTPPRGPPGDPAAPFPLETADETTLALLWAEIRDAANPVEAFTRALHARYGSGVRVFLEDGGPAGDVPAAGRSGAGRDGAVHRPDLTGGGGRARARED